MKCLATLRLTILVLLGSLLCGSAVAADYKVNQIYYRNRGAYKARAYVAWKQGSRRCEVRIGAFDSSEAGSIKLGKQSEFSYEDPTDKEICSLTEGTEVWAVVKINLGETKNCQKTENKFFFHTQTNGGREVRYKTAGETLTNNRCQILRLPPDSAKKRNKDDQ